MHLRRLRLAAQDGFTTVVVMGALLIGGALAEVAYQTVLGDIAPAQHSIDRKDAYSAAEAGLNVYAYQLTRDPNLWTKCTAVPPPNATEASPINQAWNGSGSDPRVWRKMPESNAKYTIELLPATGFATCIAGNQASMLNPTNGTFRIRSTGLMHGAKRSIIVTLRRTKFLDFLYFSDYETSDPATYPDSSSQSFAASHCVLYWPNRDSTCVKIQFAPNDVVAGPLHTNDELLTCDSPQFGRTTADSIEVVGPTPGYQKACGVGVPNVLGTYINPANALTLPSTNASLATVADPAYRFSGTTKIVLSGATMTVTNPTGSASRLMALPANGVVYVQNSSCGISGYARTQNYTNPAGCGDLWVSGTTSQSLTFATDNDIIVNGSLTTSNNAEIGLIANNFIRVYHPVINRQGDGSCTNSGLSPTNIEIDAAMLSLQHSYIVDNWYCGAALGTLTVNGAIAQKFRGPVGTSGGPTGITGYIKAYTYDDRFRYTNPPNFLDPVAASWRVVRQTEQLPPR